MSGAVLVKNPTIISSGGNIGPMSMSISSNGTYNASDYFLDGFSSVTADVSLVNAERYRYLSGANGTSGKLILFYTAYSGSWYQEVLVDSDISTIEEEAAAYNPSIRYVSAPGVTSIGNKAFYHSSLTSIDIGNVETIGEQVFSDCSSLVSITLPTSLRSIGSSCFMNDGNTALNYAGTKSEWENNVSTGWWWNGAISTLHCTDGDISLQTQY